MPARDPRIDAYIATFEGFSPSRRRDYVEWLTDAKSEGKSRNWKYEKC